MPAGAMGGLARLATSGEGGGGLRVQGSLNAKPEI